MPGTNIAAAEVIFSASPGAQERALDLVLNPDLPFAKLYTFIEAIRSAGGDYHISGEIVFSNAGVPISRVPVSAGIDNLAMLAKSIVCVNCFSTQENGIAINFPPIDAINVVFSEAIASGSDHSFISPTRLYLPADSATFRLIDSGAQAGVVITAARVWVGIIQTPVLT